MRILSIDSGYSEQPEEKVITISRIKDAKDCPRKYYRNYVEQPPPKKPFESIEAAMGQLFHNFVESHFKRLLAQNRPIRAADAVDVDELILAFRMSLFWEGRLREPYRIVGRRFSVGDFEERLRNVGRHFCTFLRQDLVGHQVVSVEGNLQIRAESFYIRGKHDLITLSSQGRRVLWDWKTGRMPEPRYFDDFQALKAQLLTIV